MVDTKEDFMNTVSSMWVGLLLMCILPSTVVAESCTGADGENVNIPFSTPSDDFTLNNDGTVIHLPTGLMWMRCSVGQNWDGENCSGGFPESVSWQNALAKTGTSFAGFTDWRLPNKNELASIVERRHCYPSVNRTMFPNTPSGGFFESWYWSSSPGASADIRVYAWGVYFGNGIVRVDDIDLRGYVRLVRTPQ
jgi:hypothetical protein